MTARAAFDRVLAVLALVLMAAAPFAGPRWSVGVALVLLAAAVTAGILLEREARPPRPASPPPSRPA